MSLTVSSLYSYPIKSAREISWQSVSVTERGLALDRHWMLVDAKGQFLSLRKLPRLTQLQVSVKQGGLMLSVPASDTVPLFVPEQPTGEIKTLSLWKDTLNMPTYDPSVSEWLSAFLGQSVHLAYFPLDGQRAIAPANTFADGFSLLVIGQGSLDALSERCNRVIDERRFRPNIVIAGAEPHAEDRWQRIRIAEVELSLVEPCARCSVPSLDPETGERSAEPNLSLRQYRLQAGKVMFGMNTEVLSTGELRLGDTVEVLA